MRKRIRPASPDRAQRPWRHAGAVVVLVIVFGPLAAAVASAAVTVFHSGLGTLALAIPMGRRLSLLAASLALSIAVATAATGLGLLCGSALWARGKRPLSIARWWLLAAAPVPPYVHALAWEVAIRWIWHAPVDGWIASWWVQTMALLPLGVVFVLAGLQSVDPRMVDAARVARSDEAAWLRVAVPLAAPSIAVGAGCLMILSLADYSVPSIFHVNVYALEIFSEFSAGGDPGAAFLVSLPLLTVVFAVMLAIQSRLRQAATARARRDSAWTSPPRWPRSVAAGQIAGLAALSAQVLVPLFTLLLATRSWSVLRAATFAAATDLSFTAGVAIAAAGLSVALCVAATPFLRDGLDRPATWWALLVLPLSIPAPLVGVGLVSMWNQGWMPPVYGTWVMPVLAALARFAPLALLALLAQYRRVDRSFGDAARLLDGRPFRVWARIEFPLLFPAMLAAGAVVLSLTIGELGATLIVTPPGLETLTIRVYNFLHYGATDSAAALCLLMAAIVAAAGSVAAIALRAGPAAEPMAEDVR